MEKFKWICMTIIALTTMILVALPHNISAFNIQDGMIMMGGVALYASKDKSFKNKTKK